MKVKTILVALLLATVMVTSSYGADQAFIDGAKFFLAMEHANTDDWQDFIDTAGEDAFLTDTNYGVFLGYVMAISGELNSNGVPLPMGVYYRAVATYVVSHPHEHFEHTTRLVVRAFRQSFPSRCPDHFWSRN